MKHGKLFVLYIGKIKPNFNTDFCGGEKDFPTKTIFNFKEFRENENWRAIVKEGEQFLFDD